MFGKNSKSETKVFGRLYDGSEVYVITLTCGEASCEVITYGAAVRSLTVPDRDGKLRDVVLGFDSVDEYVNHSEHFGAAIGRFANRIGGSSFVLSGVRYDLPANEGMNQLHGGAGGFDRQNWTISEVVSGDDGMPYSVRLTIFSPDGDQGFPGNMTLSVTYELSAEQGEDGDEYSANQREPGYALTMTYEATCDRDTIYNFTNHSYFNLNGHDSGLMLGQKLRLNASNYTPTDGASIPTGEIAPVDGTPLDFRTLKAIGDRVDSDYEQMANAGGYDKNYVIDRVSESGAGEPGSGTASASVASNRPDGRALAEAAYALSDESGISMTVLTDQPGIQLYSGNYITPGMQGKGGAVYDKRYGFCLETQNFPDSPNKENFPSAVLRAGEKFVSKTIYMFRTVK